MNHNIHQHLRDNFGPDSLKLCRDLEKTARKIGNWRNHLRFNVRCLHNGFTPVSVKLKSNVKGHRAENILRIAERKLLNERVRHVNFTISVLTNKFNELSNKLRTALPPEVFNQVEEFVNRAQTSQHLITKQRQTNKFNILKDKTQRSRSDLDRNWRANTSTRDTGNQEKWVRNFSNRQLTDNETSLLCKGLGYAVTSNKIPIADIVTATESAIKQAHLDPGKSEELRQRISSTLRNSKQPPSNLTKEERAALNDLEKDKSIIIVPADKGKCVCVLNETDYRSKCSELLSDNNTYKRIGYNPRSGYRKKVCQFVNKLETDGAIIDKEKYNLIPPTEPSVPAYYGLPKIHKPEPIPLRPIVSCIGSVTYNLAKHLTKILSPIVGKSPHHITNTQDFVDTIKDIELGDDEIITSYDVTALFTCIPPTEAIKITRQCLEEDSNLANRTTWTIDHIIEAEQLCLDTTYFSNNGQFYRQLYGCSMGNPISPIIANLVMEWFEQHALETYQGVPPRLWLRYVDDTFVIINRHEQDNFFTHINSISDNIKFTQEKCTDNKLAFLHCHVQINNERKLTTVVYRKPTHTDHYLQFGSHHPLVHKLGVIRTLHYREETIISEEINIPYEKDHIDGALRKCGYPDWAFEQAKRKIDAKKPH
ncbi:uncharacterized protein [Amphiura filiformis]|uniref:uncharacterized protein n=1 Tax=Amphiura filiformis TaxID=82378 RepID=UPI003B20B681